jgi:hypothetical protein
MKKKELAILIDVSYRLAGNKANGYSCRPSERYRLP